MRATPLLSALIFAGCGSTTSSTVPPRDETSTSQQTAQEEQDDQETEEESPDPDTESCNAIATTLSPVSDGQTDFYYRDNVMFSVTEGAEDAKIRLIDASGEAIEGSTYVDDQVEEGEPLRVVFAPDQPLKSNHNYVAELDYCGGEPSVTFQTSDLGTQVQDPALLQGWTYVMDLSKARVTKPSSAAQALLTLLDNDLSLQIDNVAGDTLELTVASTNAETGEQDTCVPSLSFNMPGNFAEAPNFKVGPVDVPFTLAGYSVMLYNGTSSATFASNGNYFAGGRLAGAVDARDIVAALAGKDILPAEEPEALCDILEGANMPCEPCRDGEIYCLNLEVDRISGERSDTYLETIEERDCHVDCASSCENSECIASEDFDVCY